MALPPESRQGYWACLQPRDCAALASSGTRSRLPAGSTVIAQGDHSGDVFIILSGLTKVVARAANRRHVVLALRGPGDIVGELANINGGRRSASVVAISRIEALAVRGDDFRRFLRHHPSAADGLHRTIVSRLREADRDRLAAACMTVGQRLARLLVNVARQHGVPAPDGGLRIDQLSQEELAACVGGAKRTVAREMHDWRARRIISTGRLWVTVHEPTALERIAGRHAPPP